MFKFSREAHSRESQSKKGLGREFAKTAGKITAATLAAGTALNLGPELSKRQDISPEQMQEAMKGREMQKMEGELPSSKEFKENVEMPEEKDLTAATTKENQEPEPQKEQLVKYKEVEVEIDMNDPYFLSQATDGSWFLEMKVTKNHEYLIEKLKSGHASAIEIDIEMDIIPFKAALQYKDTMLGEVVIILHHPDRNYLQVLAEKIIGNKNQLLRVVEVENEKNE